MIRTASIASLTLVAALSVGLKPAAAGIEDDLRWGASPVPRLVPADTAPPPAKAAAKKHPRPSDSKAARKADAPVKISGPMHIVVSLARQRVTLFADGHPVASSPASTGMPGHPTPVGVFSVIQKDRHHFSNIYGAAMPYMQRITWSGSALHEGPLPGHPASHGCIRLTSSFAQLLWKTTKIGVRVIVTRDDVAPVEISMANPFAPKPKMVDGPALTTLIKTADATGSVTPGVVTAAPAQPAETPEPSAANESASPAPEAASTTEARSAIEQEAAKPVQAPVAEGAADVTPRPVADVAPKPNADTIATPVPAERAENSAAGDAADRIPMIEPAPVSFDGMTAAEPAKPVTDERPATEVVPLPIPAPGLRNAMRSKDPVSIFISRKEAKLYVRQKMQPLFDAPVTFQQPDQPVGTHVFTAMGATDDENMRWTVISIPSNLRRGGAHHPVADLRKGSKHKAVQVVAEHTPTVDPHTVLSRVVMPPEVVERISAMFIPGSSIIVSDNKLSGETGEYTEFIVETP